MTSRPANFGYWLAQTLVWSAYALLNVTFSALAGGPSTTGLLLSVALSFWLFVASHALRAVIHARHWLDCGMVGVIWRVVLAAALLAFVIQGLGAAVILGLAEVRSPLSARVFVLYWINTTIMLVLWALAYTGYKAFERWRHGEIEHWRTQALLRQAEFDLLKAQLDPHFVFNALNNIRAVILENPQRARDMLTHLSQSLRHILQHSQRDLVSLREELAAVDDYLALIDLHTDGALAVTRTIDSAALDAQVPPLAVQLLVENAVKHGEKRNGGELALRVTRAPDRVTVEVINSGRLATKSTGIGLPNLRERLTKTFGDRASCDLSEQDARVHARLSLPA